MLLLVSILGQLGQSTTKSLIDNLARSPRQRHVVHQDSHQNAQRQQATASVLGIVGLILALWSASGYVAAFMRSANRIYGMLEGWPTWKTVPTRLGITRSPSCASWPGW